jgi:hypothetical protein
MWMHSDNGSLAGGFGHRACPQAGRSVHWIWSFVQLNEPQRRASSRLGADVKRRSRKGAGRGRYASRLIRDGRLIDACDILQTKLDNQWVPYLHDTFVKPKFKPSLLHATIFLIDTRVVLTPNIDCIYDNHATAISEGTVQVLNQTDSGIVDCIRRSRRIIIKAHGSIQNPSSLVFTRTQYASARQKYPAFYRILRSLIDTHIFLIIGAGLDDPDFQLLFEDHATELGTEVPHYILLPKSTPEAQADLVRRTRSIKVLGYDSRNNHAALVPALQELASRVQATRAEFARSQDW